MLKGVRGVLFDFDGTLAPNLDLPDMRRQVIQLTVAQNIPEHVYRDQYIVEVIEAARAYLEKKDPQQARTYADDAHQRILDIEMTASMNTQVFEQTRPLFNRLNNMDVGSVVVTRNCSAAVTQTFPDWSDYRLALLARDQVEQLKPKPGHFEDALSVLGCAAADAAIVSDGAMDMQTGRELGMRCLGVLTGSSDTQRLMEAGAHHVVPDLRALMAAL